MLLRTPRWGQCGTQVKASYPLKPHNLHICWLKGLSPALMVEKLGYLPSARASDRWRGCIWLSLVVYSIVYVPNQVFFFSWAVLGAVSRAVCSC